MKIFVYEHVSGGGLTEKPISPRILCEGFGMLRTISSDFQAAGHSVTVSLDSRISVFQRLLDADQVFLVSFLDQTRAMIKTVARSVNAAYIIAPETNGILESLVKDLERNNTQLMNSASLAIAAVRSKDSLLDHTSSIGLPTPTGITLSANDKISEISQAIADKIGFPAIIKPLSDAGMTGLSLVKKKTEIPSAIGKIIQESGSNRFIAQEFVEGVPASVSLISTGEQTMAISLNKQNVRLSSASNSSTYDGGEVPLEHPLKKEAMNVARRVVESYDGLKGYIGVDVVLSESGPLVIEVNPRLTTSYIGLRAVAAFNPAQAILDASIQHKLPADEPSDGYVCFSKVETPMLSAAALERTFKMKSVVSPPFPLRGELSAFGLVYSKGISSQEAALQLEKAKSQLLNVSHLGSG